jgi:hypothetical protein
MYRVTYSSTVHGNGIGTQLAVTKHCPSFPKC